MTILPHKCIFCDKEKYIKKYRTTEKHIKKYRTTEKLSSCVQLRADDKIRQIAKNRNDSNIIAMTSDKLIAKEACYLSFYLLPGLYPNREYCNIFR